jgi:hypothetical protein
LRKKRGARAEGEAMRVGKDRKRSEERIRVVWIFICNLCGRNFGFGNLFKSTQNITTQL